MIQKNLVQIYTLRFIKTGHIVCMHLLANENNPSSLYLNGVHFTQVACTSGFLANIHLHS